MIRKETWILILILAALVGLAWYLNQPNSPTKANATPTPTVAAPRYLITTTSSDIAGFSLTSQSGASFFLQRGPGGVWIVKQPSEGIADQGKAEEIATQLASLRILTTLESAPPASATGLDKPGYTLAITITDGKVISVKIGNLTATGNGYYVEDEAGQVHVINKTSIAALIDLLSSPPYAETLTPSPAPSETPAPTVENTATFEPTGTSKP